MDSTLVAKATDEGFDQGRAKGRGKLQALDGNRLVQADVRASIHDAEAPFSNVALDTELSVEHLTAEPEGIGGNHGARISAIDGIRVV